MYTSYAYNYIFICHISYIIHPMRMLVSYIRIIYVHIAPQKSHIYTWSMYSPTTEAGEIQDVAHGMPSLQEGFETSKKRSPKTMGFLGKF